MKVGTIMQLTSFDGKPDLQTYQEELSVADKAEDYGFDSLWSLDHHFTGYVMSPDPCQLLSYMAGRTRKIQLGTAVIVLPWHDPVEVAEKIALLDLVSGGRTIFGFGRGAATVEYAGFRIPMDESRERFVECADIIRRGLTQESFSYEGKYYRIPDIQIRPAAHLSPGDALLRLVGQPGVGRDHGEDGLRGAHHRPSGVGRTPRPTTGATSPPRRPAASRRGRRSGCSTCWCPTTRRRPRTWPSGTWGRCSTRSRTTTGFRRAG